MKQNRFKVGVIGTGNIGRNVINRLCHSGMDLEIKFLEYTSKTTKRSNKYLKYDFEDSNIRYNNSFVPIEAVDYAGLKDCNIIVISIKGSQMGESSKSRFKFIESNGAIIKLIAQQLKATNYNNLLLVVSNPVEQLSQILQAELGIAAHKVFGTGTLIDTYRLQILMGKHYQKHMIDLPIYILGEHSEDGVLYSSCLNSIYQQIDVQKEAKNIQDIFEQAVMRPGLILESQGYTCAGIGLCVNNIIKSIYYDANQVMPVSCQIPANTYGNKIPLYISMFAQLNYQGIKKVMLANFNQKEKNQMLKLVQRMESYFTS